MMTLTQIFDILCMIHFQAAIEKEKLHLLCADVPILENQVDMYVCIPRNALGQATLIL